MGLLLNEWRGCAHIESDIIQSFLGRALKKVSKPEKRKRQKGGEKWLEKVVLVHLVGHGMMVLARE